MSAPARVAMEWMTFAPAAVSSVPTIAHERSFFHAGALDALGKRSLGGGSLSGGQQRSFVGGKVGSEDSVELLRVDDVFGCGLTAAGIGWVGDLAALDVACPRTW